MNFQKNILFFLWPRVCLKVGGNGLGISVSAQDQFLKMKMSIESVLSITLLL